MKPITYWATALVSDSALFAGLYFGVTLPLEQLVSLVVFWAWAGTTLCLIVGLLGDKTVFKMHPRPKGFAAYHWATEIGMISAFVVLGYLWLPIARLVGVMLVEGARNREPKERGE